MSMALTIEHVQAAYGALASGSREECAKYWAEELEWLVPGHNHLSGWKHGLDEFLAFMQRVGELSAHSFHMTAVTVMVNDTYSCDVTNNQGHRAGDPGRRLDIDVAHVLKWRDGKVVEGKGAIFGDGTAQYDEFWS